MARILSRLRNAASPFWRARSAKESDAMIRQSAHKLLFVELANDGFSKIARIAQPARPDGEICYVRPALVSPALGPDVEVIELCPLQFGAFDPAAVAFELDRRLILPTEHQAATWISSDVFGFPARRDGVEHQFR